MMAITESCSLALAEREPCVASIISTAIHPAFRITSISRLDSIMSYSPRMVRYSQVHYPSFNLQRNFEQFLVTIFQPTNSLRPLQTFYWQKANIQIHPALFIWSLGSLFMCFADIFFLVFDSLDSGVLHRVCILIKEDLHLHLWSFLLPVKLNSVFAVSGFE